MSDAERVDGLRQTDETPSEQRMAQIRDRAVRLAKVPLETSASNYIMRDMIDSIGDVRWLLAERAEALLPLMPIQPGHEMLVGVLSDKLDQAKRDIDSWRDEALRLRTQLAEHTPGPALHAVRDPNGSITPGDADWCRTEAAPGHCEHVQATVCGYHSGWQQTEDAARAKFAADMDRLWKTDPAEAQWIEHILTERTEQQTEAVVTPEQAAAELRQWLDTRTGTDRLGRDVSIVLDTLAAALARTEQAETITARVTDRMREYDRHGGGTVNIRQVLNLLSPTWPDGNYEATLAGGDRG